MKNIDWIKGAVIYQVFPDRFAKSPVAKTDGIFESWDSPETADGFKGGNLLGVEEKLDYIKELGANVLYFTPIFASAANHRYHTFDYYAVDPVLGGNPALKSLIKAAHRRGIKIILDGVFNHASRGFFQFNHLLENGAASPYRKWFHPNGYPLKAYNLGKNEKPNYACWWNLPALPKFNTANPEVRNFILGVARYWLEQGIDGWRLDVPYEINDDSFWREFRRVCKAVNPGCYLTGEIWGEASRWLKGDQFDAVMNYRLSAECISYFGGDKLKLSQPYAGRVLKPIKQAAFIRNISAQLAGHQPGFALAQMNMMSSHDTDRMPDTYGGDMSRVKLAVVFSFLFPGAVNIYYGEEIGLAGVFNAGTRRGMPWKSKKLWDLDLLKLYKALAKLRGAEAIKNGKFEFLKAHCDGEVLAFRRSAPGSGLTCFMNTGPAAKELALKKAPGRALLSSGVAPSRRGGEFRLKLAPGAFAVFQD